MINLIIESDYSLFILINSLHTTILDSIMVIFTKALPWIPLYIAILGTLLYKFGYREQNWKKALFATVALLLTFAITDIGSSQIKKGFEILRPSHDLRLEGIVRLLDGKGGLYGFISSHAANVFGLATLTSLFFRKRWYSISIFTWATIVSYSRIYVGRHFPSDVVCGALFGVAVALAVYKLNNFLIAAQRDVLHN
ncbi:MAG: phosphatase PAP2 family protein [Bacteroidales bacterium]